MNRTLLVFSQLLKIKPTLESIKRHVILSPSLKKSHSPKIMDTQSLPKIIFVLGAPGN